MEKWKTIVSVVLVFILGAVAGALVTHRIYQQKIENIMKNEPRTRSEFIVQRLNHELHLDTTQLEQLRLIIKDTHTEIKNVRKQFRPQMDEILARSQDKVRAILRPDQLTKYEKIMAERRKRREKEESSN
jgi:uncharacterized protein YneF (UPF0154 family)